MLLIITTKAILVVILNLKSPNCSYKK